MASRRKTTYQKLIKTYGFLPSEAQQLSKTSRRGFQAPYMRRFLMSRRALFMNAKRYGWTETQYRDVIKEQYVDRGCLKQDILGRIRADVWQMVRYYEDRTPKPDEYESPWRKKVQKQSERKRETKRTTRRRWLSTWISEIDQKLTNASLSFGRREQLTTQRNNLQAQLNAMGSE